MRSGGALLWNRWRQGLDNIGPDGRSNGYVTVEPGWTLRATVEAGAYKKVPVRYWYQPGAIQVSLPNIATIIWDDSVETDAAECKIAIFNQKMDPNESVGNGVVLGQPGYFTWSRATSAAALARWGPTFADTQKWLPYPYITSPYGGGMVRAFVPDDEHYFAFQSQLEGLGVSYISHNGGPGDIYFDYEPPALWANALVPNALLRTFEGYGGWDEDLTDGRMYQKPLDEALAAGNVVQTGVWLVDEVTASSQGMLQLACRNLAKLPVEQPLMPPLVPYEQYPDGLRYCRWKETFATNYEPKGAQHALGASSSEVNHPPEHSFDNNPDTAWICASQSSKDAVQWIELDNPGGTIDVVAIRPWGGNYHCLAGETRVLTHDGVYPIRDLAGKTARLLTMDPRGPRRWVNAPVHSFGVQRLQKITLRRNKVTKVIHATPEHRWFVRRYKYSAGGSYNLATSEATTAELRAGDRMASVMPPTASKNIIPSPVGIAHGLVFGDGTVQRNGCRLDLWGRDVEMLRYFPEHRIRPVNSAERSKLGTGVEGLEVFGFPFFFKRLPALDESPAYLMGWLAGYFAADGHVTADGQVTLPCIDRDVLEYVRVICNRLGIGTFGIRAQKRDPHGLNPDGGDSWVLGFMADTMPESFFVLSHKRDAFVNRTGRTKRVNWIVDSVEDTDREEEVFCAVVPETHSFALEDNILTGNCYVSVMIAGEWWDKDPENPTSAPGGGPPYLADSGTPFDQTIEFHLGDSYFADKVRLTFTNLLLRPEGDYRCGVREYEAAATSTSVTGKVDGDYLDYVDIIKDFLMWCGFYAGTGTQPDPAGGVLGNLESTGAYAEDCITADTFDKKNVIDGINTIRDIVGYHFWVDSDGLPRFESPNWWSSGNFFEDGSHTEFIPDIDERLQMTDYTVRNSDRSVRSEFVIATEDPDKTQLNTTVTTRYTPMNAAALKGIVKPLMWLNKVFTSKAEQVAMANLIAIHSWFGQRQGQVTIVANPLIQRNDQVRLWERVTSETYIHYVRGVHSELDLQTGVYKMTLTTHWLGDWPTPWAIEDMIGPELAQYLEDKPVRSLLPGRITPLPQTALPAGS